MIAPYSFCKFAETASLIREGDLLFLPYSTQNPIRYDLPRMFYEDSGLIDIPSEDSTVGLRHKWLIRNFNIWSADWISQTTGFPGASGSVNFEPRAYDVFVQILVFPSQR